MKKTISIPSFILILLASFCSVSVSAETRSIDLTKSKNVTPHNAIVKTETFKGKRGIKAQISEEASERLAEIRRQREASGTAGGRGAGEANRVDHLIVVDKDFHNGTIELEVAGQPAPGSSGGARGFVGIAFRANPEEGNYDCFYLRPTNGRAEDQERRNHSAQYISHPDYPWFRLRKETPSKYEAYVDLIPEEWTKVKIVVDGEKARLYVHGNEHPTIIVNDLKSGANGSGAVALWFEGSTIARYTNLTITE